MNVLLIHGMGRTPLSMASLGRWLRVQGHHVESIGYLSATQSFDAIVTRVHARIASIAARGQAYAIVAHSLGGIIARAALATAPSISPLPAHLVMLGTPNQPSSLARRLQGVWPYRWFTGESGARLANDAFFATLPPPNVPYTTIAGTRGPRGRMSVFGAAANDGKVAVSETRVHPLDHSLELPVRHTFMMNDAAVRRLIQGVLARADASPAEG